MHLLESPLCLACFDKTNFFGYFQVRSEILKLWAACYGSLFATHQSTKQLNLVADGCIWMSDFALAKVSVFSNLPIVYGEMVLCFIFPTSRDLHANTFRELSEGYADLIRHAGFHFPTTGNFTLWYFSSFLISTFRSTFKVKAESLIFHAFQYTRKPQKQ